MQEKQKERYISGLKGSVLWILLAAAIHILGLFVDSLAGVAALTIMPGYIVVFLLGFYIDQDSFLYGYLLYSISIGVQGVSGFTFGFLAKYIRQVLRR